MARDSLERRVRTAVLDGDSDAAKSLACEAMTEAIAPAEILDWYVEGIREVGRLWEEGEYFLPELVSGAEAVVAGLDVLKPALAGDPKARTGRVAVIGTVAGDIHEIGKSLVGNMLLARGFEVHDLGTDVPADAFVDAVEEHGACLLGLSALLTTTMVAQKAVIELLEERGLRPGVKVLVGGAPVSAAWAREIGADGTAPDAMGASELACGLLDGAAGA